MGQDTIYFTTRDQIFTVELYGLKPLTTHYCYFERNAVSASSVKPLNGKLGDPIITNASGAATFDFYYKSGVTDRGTEVSKAQKLAASIGGKKELVVADYNEPTLVNDFENTTSSFFKGQIDITVYIPPENQWTTRNEVINMMTDGGGYSINSDGGGE